MNEEHNLDPIQPTTTPAPTPLPPHAPKSLDPALETATDGPRLIPARRFLCVWIPNWPIQRLIVRQPDLRRQRIVLFYRDSRRGQLVSAASPLALRSGVQIEMPMSEAKSLLRRADSQKRSNYHPTHRKHPRDQHRNLAQNGIDAGETPNAHGDTTAAAGTEKSGNSSPAKIPTPAPTSDSSFIYEHDPTVDLAAMEQLADSLHEFSPIVGLDQTERPDSIFLDITGLAHLFGDETQLVRQLTDYFEQQNYLTRVAAAPTLGQAWALTRFPCETKADCPVLDSLPIHALRLSELTTQTLDQLGITTIGQLMQIPRKDLLSRFGPEIHKRLDQFTGTIDEPIVARYRPPDFSAEQLLEFPTNSFKTIEVLISRLVKNVCQQMRARQQGALEWTVRLKRLKAEAIEFRVNLFRPTATVEHVMQLTQMQLENALGDLKSKFGKSRKRLAATSASGASHTTSNAFAPFTEVSVSVTACVLLAQNQRQLFDENPRLDKQSLAQLVNRLTSRMGQENVVYPTLQSGAQPEYSVRFRPLVDPRGTHHRRSKSRKRKAESHVMSRPLRLLNPPIKLETLTVHSTPNHHHSSNKIARPPALLTYQHNMQTLRKKIVHTWGPERIETGWWRGPTTRRDYWRVETETHQQFWIFYDLRKRTWFLHGEF